MRLGPRLIALSCSLLALGLLPSLGQAAPAQAQRRMARREVGRHLTTVAVGRLKIPTPASVRVFREVRPGRVERTRVRRRRVGRMVVEREVSPGAEGMKVITTRVTRMTRDMPSKDPVDRSLTVINEVLELAGKAHLRRDKIDWERVNERILAAVSQTRPSLRRELARIAAQKPSWEVRVEGTADSQLTPLGTAAAPGPPSQSRALVPLPTFSVLARRLDTHRGLASVQIVDKESGEVRHARVGARTYVGIERRSRPIAGVRRRQIGRLWVERRYRLLAADGTTRVETRVLRLPRDLALKEPVARAEELAKRALRLVQREGGEIAWHTLTNRIVDGIVDALPDLYSGHLPVEIDAIGAAKAGIGVAVKARQRPGSKSEAVIDRVVRGGPAHKAKLRRGDRIVAVNGEKVRDADHAIEKIARGEGATVRLKVRRGTQSLEREVTRGPYDPMQTKTELRKGVGYVRLAIFEGKERTLRAEGNEKDEYVARMGPRQGMELVTLRKLDSAVTKLEKRNGGQPLKGLVVDLRGNNGGELNNALALVNRFVGAGKMVELRGNHGKLQESFSADAASTRYANLPLAVLIGKRTLSSSELFTGVMQDLGRGEVLGTRSGGKGTALTQAQLRDNSLLYLTTETYHLPSGRTPHIKGLSPDISRARSRDWYREHIGEKRADYSKEHAFHLLERGLIPIYRGQRN